MLLEFFFGVDYQVEKPSMRFKLNPHLRKIIREMFKNGKIQKFSWSLWNGGPLVSGQNVRS